MKGYTNERFQNNSKGGMRLYCNGLLADCIVGCLDGVDMTCCALCGDIRKFHEIDREELEAMIFDFGQSIATMKVNVHARQPHRFVYVDLERLERDLRAIRDRVIIDGEEFFEPEVPF